MLAEGEFKHYECQNPGLIIILSCSIYLLLFIVDCIKRILVLLFQVHLSLMNFCMHFFFPYPTRVAQKVMSRNCFFSFQDKDSNVKIERQRH